MVIFNIHTAEIKPIFPLCTIQTLGERVKHTVSTLSFLYIIIKTLERVVNPQAIYPPPKGSLLKLVPAPRAGVALLLARGCEFPLYATHCARY